MQQNITTHAEGMALYAESMQRNGDEGDRLFILAMRKFEAASPSILDNQSQIKTWVFFLKKLKKKNLFIFFFDYFFKG